ncbi:MAG: nuclear transport factor 2 family protein [Novosphingobium sp.]
MTPDSALADRMLIRERMSAYADAAFRGDLDAYLACWSEDGVRIGNGAEVRGKPALRAQWLKIWAILDRMTFFTETCAIEVEGDRATARCYCREILLLKSGGMRKVVGRYDDELVRENGIWLFARREYALFIDEGASPAPASGAA